MIEKKRVAVIFGGRSCEHDVSVSSAASVIEYLDTEKYEIIPIAITKDGAWHWNVTPKQLLQAYQNPELEKEINTTPIVTLAIDAKSKEFFELQRKEPLLVDGKIDVLFPVLHGPYGEDGTIQGIFEMANAPFVGCDVVGSAIGMDKEIMKILFKAAGLPIVDSLAYKRFQWERSAEKLLQEIEDRLHYPCFVKPANMGSSVGVNKARNREELTTAINEAFTYDRKIVIEQGLEAREFSCAILGNENPQASAVGEILPGDEFSDYEDKYINHTIQFIIPSKLPTETAQNIQEMALTAYQALDLSGLSRVDFFQDKNSGQFYINEVNTLPGFTSQSLYPKLWAASGLSYPDLLDRLIELAFERYEMRQGLRSQR